MFIDLRLYFMKLPHLIEQYETILPNKNTCLFIDFNSIINLLIFELYSFKQLLITTN